MDNPMRDVIEQMKDAAQREGKQQTSPVARAAMERRRQALNQTTAQTEETDMNETATITLIPTQSSTELKQIADVSYDTYRNARGVEARQAAQEAYLRAQEAWYNARKEGGKA